MIARNFTRYPEALRFQRELFHNGFHNSPRIMRLVECMFDWKPTAPDWWKEAKGRARDLAKRVQKSIGDFFKGVVVATVAREHTIENAPTCARWNPCLRATENDQDMMPIGAGRYRNYCRKKTGYQGHAAGVGHHLAYWGGFSE